MTTVYDYPEITSWEQAVDSPCLHADYDEQAEEFGPVCGKPATCAQVVDDLWDTPDGVLHSRDVYRPMCGYHGNAFVVQEMADWAVAPGFGDLDAIDLEGWTGVRNFIGVELPPYAPAKTEWNDEPPF